MKHLVRSIKYFFYFAFLTTLIICALVLTGLAEGDIDTMFRGGSSAIWKMAVFFVAIAAVYPKVGFITRRICTDRSWSETRNEVIGFMKERRYDLESEEDGTVTFRQRGTADRLRRMYEDRVTIIVKDDGLEMEGLRKDVFRLSANLEYHLNPQQ
jgi:hypothetical protein